MTAFYSAGQLWYESRVSWGLKRCFFICRVVNTALSGIEASRPSNAQYQSYVAGDLSSQEGGAAARRQCPTRRYCVSGNWHFAMLRPECEDSGGRRCWCRTLRTMHN